MAVALHIPRAARLSQSPSHPYTTTRTRHRRVSAAHSTSGVSRRHSPSEPLPCSPACLSLATQELEAQIRDQKARKQHDKEARQRQELRDDKRLAAYNPFGRGGGGELPG